MSQVVEDAIWLGVACGMAAALARFRRLEPFFLVLVTGCVGIAFWRGNLNPKWAWTSFGQDVPWAFALSLGVWAAQARLGWLKVQGWMGAVIGGFLIGDLAVAVSLAAHEPDANRRTRLALAASGASLVGRSSGATLILGWEPKIAALGILLALVGYCGGGFSIGVEKPRNPVDGLLGLSSAIGAGVLVWLLAVGGNMEFAALQLEGFPLSYPGEERWLALGPAVLLGLVFDEGAAALAISGTLDRAMSIKSDWALQSMIAGIGTAGGLQAMLLARGNLKTGLVAFGTQLLVLIAWVLWIK